jgi:hypothetical protein
MSRFALSACLSTTVSSERCAACTCGQPAPRLRVCCSAQEHEDDAGIKHRPPQTAAPSHQSAPHLSSSDAACAAVGYATAVALYAGTAGMATYYICTNALSGKLSPFLTAASQMHACAVSSACVTTVANLHIGALEHESFKPAMHTYSLFWRCRYANRR